MAPPKKNEKNNTEDAKVNLDDLTTDLIKELNKESDSRVAWNLSTDISPTHVVDWYSTGSSLLDAMISNKATGGGLPGGRIVEIFGPPSIGKSHIAAQICISAQKKGGIAVYMDTENAVNPENLSALGVNTKRRFVYAQPECIEEVFRVAESTINKLKSINKEIPVVIVWDSLAASPAKAELEGEYEDNSIGLAARKISQSLRKFTQLVGNKNVLFVILNQTRTKVGVMHGDPTTTPGGAAVPFHSSVRIQLIGGKKIMSENDKELPVGINITAKIIKNKIAYPYRRAEFEIHFGKGIVETEQFFDHVREQGEIQGDGKENLIEINVSGKKYLAGISGTQAWKYLRVYDGDTGTEALEFCKNFNKSDFFTVKNDPKYKPFVDGILERLLVLRVEPELTEEFVVQEAEKIEKKILLD